MIDDQIYIQRDLYDFFILSNNNNFQENSLTFEFEYDPKKIGSPNTHSMYGWFIPTSTTQKLPSFVGKYMLYNGRHFATWATALRQKQPDGKMEGL